MAAMLWAVALLQPGTADAQSRRTTRLPAALTGAAEPALLTHAPDRYVVVIDLDTHRLSFRRGETTLWSAPVGTGTGMRLRSADGEWDFSTPVGSYQVQYKELDPAWIAPDWFFIENGLSIPPKNHPSRVFPRGLGAAAVYIHPSLAVHGTDRPELLGQAVSHGCIRLENRYALRLYYNVQVGTEVVIVGGDDREGGVTEPGGGDADWLEPAPGRPTSPADGWTGLETPALLAEMDRILVDGPEAGPWDRIGVLLTERAGNGDAAALTGLLTRTGSLPPSQEIRHEWSTFLVDVFRRKPLRSLELASSLDPATRGQVAQGWVEASVALYQGDLDGWAAPWPTRTLPAAAVTPAARPAWQALEAAERAFRDRRRLTPPGQGRSRRPDAVPPPGGLPSNSSSSTSSPSRRDR